ncbi:MAG: LLM class flavin-dependent oxidoreductase [Microbacterium sp.]
MTGDPIGLAVGYDPALTVREMAQQQRTAEEAGFTTAFFSETLFTNRDSVSALTAFAYETSRMTLGTTQVVRLRSPLVMAQTAASLDEISGGRVALSLGAFTQKHALRNGRPLTDPVATLREYVAVIRRLLAGETVTFHGEAVVMEDAALNFTPLRADIPIWIAAASRRGLLNAGAIGDGVLLDAGASPEYAANAVALLRQGAEEAGRDPEGLMVAQLLNTSIDHDEEEALEAVRWEVASKFTFRSTPRAKLSVGEPVIDRADLPRFEEALARGGKAGLARIIPDSYVRGLTLPGTPDQVRRRVQEYRDAGVTLPLVRPARAEQLPLLIETFSTART